MTYDPMDEIQIAEINSQVRRYLEGTLDEIDVRTTMLAWPPPLTVLDTIPVCMHRGWGMTLVPWGQGP